MKRFEELTLEDFKQLDDKSLYDEYNQQIANLGIDRISKRIVLDMYGDPIIDIYKKVESSYQENTSNEIFPNDLVLLHGGIRENKTKIPIRCDFSGTIIRKGTLYINYRPLIENLTTGNSYVLSKTIKVREEYIDCLPNNIQDLEILQINMMLEKSDEMINYEYLHRKFDGGFVLRKLRRNNNEIRYRK